MRVWARNVETFNAHILVADLGPLAVLRMSGSSHRVDRGSREIERSGEHTYHLLANSMSAWTLAHRGHAQLRVGDGAFTDSEVPHQLDFTEYDVLHLKMSEAWVRQWLPTPGVLIGRPILKDLGWGRALCAFMGQLSPEFMAATPLPPTVIADQVGALLALVSSEMNGSLGTATKPEKAMRDRIRECITQRCMEPAINATDIALSLNISTRTLHRNLASCNETFGGRLMSARTELAMRMLQSPLFKRLSTAEIGRRAGFVDASHFSRAFRKRMGRTPSQVRDIRTDAMSSAIDLPPT
jgi:AraC-like DNA-binding protein